VRNNPACQDPASPVIQSIIAVMRALFSPTSDCPPLGGGSDRVWFLAGEGAPIEEVNCDQPFLWVRLASRYHSEFFPDASLVVPPCGAPEVLVVEVGVARCASMDDPNFDAYTNEAAVSLDDCWRLSRMQCAVSGHLNGEHQVGADTINPYGPEGGVIAWMSTLYISV
jgi:hypothetical protein